MDGSSAPFVYLIRRAGILVQREPRCVLRMRRPLEIRDGARWIRIDPARGLRVHYAVDYDHRAIGRQELDLDLGDLDEVEALWAGGFARGASIDNTVVLDEKGVVNPAGLRWPDEFVRHKLLDLVGDLALLGMPIHGRIRAERGGHSLHQRLVAAILETPSAWRIDVAGSAAPAPLWHAATPA